MCGLFAGMSDGRGLLGRETIDRLGAVSLTWLQDGAGEVLLVRAVWVMLGLENKTAAINVWFAGFSLETAVEEVTTIELDSGFLGQDFHEAPAGRLMHRGGEGHLALFVALVEYEIVVVAEAELELLILLANVPAYCFGGGEIKGSALDRAQFPGGDEALVHGREVICVEVELMVKNSAIAFTGEVEVGVLCQVDRSGLVRGGVVVDDDLVVIGERVAHFDLEVAGVAFLPVLGKVAEFHPAETVAGDGFGIPDDFVKTDYSAMKVVDPVVGGETVFLPIDGEFAFGNAVAVAADHGTEVRFVHGVDVVFNTAVAQGDVFHLAIAVGNDDGGDDGTIVGDTYLHAVFVFERIDFDGIKVRLLHCRRSSE